MPDLDRFHSRGPFPLTGERRATATPDGRVTGAPTGTFALPTMPPAPAGSRRSHLSVPMLRVLGADCGACQGVGCLACEHTGLR